MASEADKAELDRERRQLRQERADLERRLADFDRRQVCAHVTLLYGQPREFALNDLFHSNSAFSEIL